MKYILLFIAMFSSFMLGISMIQPASELSVYIWVFNVLAYSGFTAVNLYNLD